MDVRTHGSTTLEGALPKCSPMQAVSLRVIGRLNCLLWGNASPLTALENDNRRAGSKD